MPRDVSGKPVKPERAAEPVKEGPAKDPISTPKEAKEAVGGPAEMLRHHNDLLITIADNLGIKHKLDGYKGEDQGGKAKIEVGEKRKHH
jgi:hypothetical protein